MRDLVPALRYVTLALGDEAPLVARRLALAAAGLLAAVSSLLIW